MEGLYALARHLIVIGCAYVLAMAVIYIVHKVRLKNLRIQGDGVVNKDKERTIGRACKSLYITITGLAIIIVIFFVLFQFNPTHRSEDEMKLTTPAEIDESYKPPTKEAIEKSNKEAAERPHQEKEEEAEKANIKAMEESIELFRKTGK